MKEVNLKPQRTKIVCTLGPASSSPEVLRGLMKAGAEILRINLSHGTQETHSQTIATARAVAEELKHNAAILLDLRGAKIRTTTSQPSPFELRKGSMVDLAGGEDPSTEKRLHITPAVALQNLKAGDRILIDDGKIELGVVSSAEAGAWHARVEVGGSVKDRRGVTLVDVPTDQLPGLTEKDIADIEFGVKQGVEFFALSFVRSAADIHAARKEISRLGAEVPIIAKLEKPEAVDHLDAILDACYGVMVARGDLGVEASLERVPVLQKKIIAAARKHRKPVITATQMLETMTESPVPTRAEVSDVANAVFDGTDAVMLSGETSIGKYPIEAVKMMARTVAEAETAVLGELKSRTFSLEPTTVPDAIAEGACVAAESVGAKCIAVYTASGYSAAVLSGHRPGVPIYAFSDQALVVRRLALLWGVEARLVETPASVERFLRTCESLLLADKLVGRGDLMVFVAGIPFRKTGNTNILKLHRLGEE